MVIKMSSSRINNYKEEAKEEMSHVPLTQILPVAIRGIMDEHVRDTRLALCNFFDIINRKSIGVKRLDRL